MRGYLNTPDGAVYGFAALPPTTRILSGFPRTPHTPMPGLYLASAFGGEHGFNGAMLSGARGARKLAAARPRGRSERRRGPRLKSQAPRQSPSRRGTSPPPTPRARRRAASSRQERRELAQLRHLRQRIAIEHAQIEQFIEPRQRPIRQRPLDALEPIARLGDALAQHAIIPAGAPARLHAARHIRPRETGVQLPAGLAPLAHLQQRRAECEDIADADVALGDAERRNILAEGRRRAERLDELRPLLRPGVVMIARIMMQRLFRPAVMTQIALTVAGEAVAQNAPGRQAPRS